jgi:GH15 family glucan-1,4-alpha-glucosidase
MSIVGRDPLAERSLRVLRDGQALSGAFVASPAFRVYDFGWLRDGAFCAYALDRAGDHDAAAAFHRWAASTIERYRPMAEAAIARVERGDEPPFEAMLPARFTLAGALEEPDPADPWPNFQLDGYGMWLWSLESHLKGRSLAASERDVVVLVARYLAAAWPLKCCSCWEELQSGEHASTIGAVVAGLASAARLLDDASWQAEADTVRGHLLDRFACDGRLGRSPGDDRVDGSMIWLSVPFEVLPADDPRLSATIDAIKRDLIGPSGGVYRYLGDTYYGGGEWLLLASSLAWQDAVAAGGDAEELRAWVRGQATRNGDLPEQVTGHAQDPAMVQPWVERWGPVANPLLWSHAMFLVSEDAAR